MKSIQRYALAMVPKAGIGWHPFMEPCKDGLYVSHADHAREVAALNGALEREAKRCSETMHELAALRGLLQRISELQSTWSTPSDELWNYCAEHVDAALQSGKEE